MRKSALQLYFDGHLPLTCRKSVSCVTLQEMKFIEKDQYPSLRLMEERTRYVSLPLSGHTTLAFNSEKGNLLF